MAYWYPLAHRYTEEPQPATEETFAKWARKPSWLLEEGVCLALGYVPRDYLNAAPHPSHDDAPLGNDGDPARTWYTLHRDRITGMLDTLARDAKIPLTQFEPYLVCVTPRDFLISCKRCGIAVRSELTKCVDDAAKVGGDTRREQDNLRRSSYLPATASALLELEAKQRVSKKELLGRAIRKLPEQYANDPICPKTFSRDIEAWRAPSSGVSSELLELFDAHLLVRSSRRTHPRPAWDQAIPRCQQKPTK
jgi:hypothetical protein